MANLKIERRGRPVVPWIAGLLALALLVWAVAELVEPPQSEGEATQIEVDEGPAPAAIPAQASPVADAARSLDEIAPLGPEDLGQNVRVSGRLVQPSANGFWLRTADGTLLHVRSDRTPGDGDVQATGVLRSVEETLEPPAAEGEAIREMELAEQRREPSSDTGGAGPGE